MKTTIKMDRAGHVVIPRPIREKYGLSEGEHELEVLESEEGILLRPSAEEIPAERHESGWVVFRSGDQPDTNPARAVQVERKRRLRRVMDPR